MIVAGAMTRLMAPARTASRRIDRTVADAPYRGDELGVRAVALDLLADAAYMDSDGRGVAVAPTPHGFEQLVSAERDLWVAHQECEERELASGEGDQRAFDADLARCEVDVDSIAAQAARRFRGGRPGRHEAALRAPQHCCDPRGELAR
jgi:hypothetical protein